METLLTLCMIRRHPHILLGMKKRGFGEGRWNGFGGKVLPGETIEEACIRELEEEAKIRPGGIEKCGIIAFESTERHGVHEVHIFCADEFEGEPEETEEMKPEWFHLDEIPFASMWPSDLFWYPLFLQGKKFRGRFLFGPEDRILEQDMEEVPEL